MKKIISAFFLFVIIFIFSACNQNVSEATALSLESFSNTVTFNEKKIKIKAKLVYNSEQNIILEVIEPKEISEVRFLQSEGEYSACFDGVSTSLNSFENCAGTYDGFKTLFEALSAINQGTFEKSGRMSYSGEFVNGKAVVTVDENGKLAKLKTASYSYEFTN